MIEIVVPEPPDGFTSYERILLRDVVVSIYKNIDNPIDKFLVCITLECGYNQEEAARMLGFSQANVSKRIKKTLDTIRQKRKDGKI